MVPIRICRIIEMFGARLSLYKHVDLSDPGSIFPAHPLRTHNKTPQRISIDGEVDEQWTNGLK